MGYSYEPAEKIQSIIERHSATIIRLAFTYVKNISDAEDIAQDVFLAYIQKPTEFSNDGHEKAWLMRVTINKCKDYLKSGWKKQTVPIPDDLSYIPQEDFLLLQTVFGLEEKYRLPIYLFYFDSYSIKEIAALLNINASTIGTRLERGRNIIKNKLGDYYE